MKRILLTVLVIALLVVPVRALTNFMFWKSDTFYRPPVDTEELKREDVPEEKIKTTESIFAEWTYSLKDSSAVYTDDNKVKTDIKDKTDSTAKYGCNNLFIGDSITFGMSTISGLDKEKNKFVSKIGHQVPNKDQKDKAMYYEDIETYTPKNIYILFGYNDIADSNSIPNFITNYTAYIKWLQSKFKNTNISIVSIPPAGGKATGRNKFYTEANTKLKGLAKELSVNYKDVTTSNIDFKKRDSEGYHWSTSDEYKPLMDAIIR